MIATVACGGRKSTARLKIPDSVMLRMKSGRLPRRTERGVETATPRMREARPNPLNQLKSFSLPATYLKKGSMTLPRMEMAAK